MLNLIGQFDIDLGKIIGFVVIALAVLGGIAEQFKKKNDDKDAGETDQDFEVVVNERGEYELRPRNGSEAQMRPTTVKAEQTAAPSPQAIPPVPPPERPEPRKKPQPIRKVREVMREIEKKAAEVPKVRRREPSPAPQPQRKPAPQQQQRSSRDRSDRQRRSPAVRGSTAPLDLDKTELVERQDATARSAERLKALIGTEQPTAQDFRKAIILAEIMAPPVGMRELGEDPLRPGL